MASDAAPALPRFDAVDGLRAWMAWGVVAAHIVNMAGLSRAGRLWNATFELGNWAVQTFIIISGFVITHLLLSRQERYLPYIARRFMRLWPALVVACVIGWAAYLFAASASAPAWFDAHHRVQFERQQDHPLAHALLHLTMLHGLVPNGVLDLAEYAFLPPAWSVSLEWQFYLVAPFVIAALRDRRWWLPFVIVAAVSLLVHRHWLAIGFGQPSLILGNTHWFALGIASRFAIPALAGRVRYPASLGIAALLAGFALQTPPIGFWLACYAFLLTDRSALIGAERALFGAGRLVLESAPVQILAARSYSTYLLHWPIMLVLGAIGSGSYGLDGLPLAAFLLLTVPAVLIAQEGLYRLVEQPGQSLGRAVARRLGQPPLPERHVEVAAG